MQDWEREMSELVRTRHRALLGYAYLLSSNIREAEDLVQDALVKTFSRRSVPQQGTSEGYVRRAIFTLYLDTYRRRRRWSGIKHLVGGSARRESADDATSDAVDVAAALQRLSPRQRSCVILRHFDDLTVAQIATELGIAEGTVGRHLHDAHATLRQLLADHAPTTGTPSRFAPARPTSTPDEPRSHQ